MQNKLEPYICLQNVNESAYRNEIARSRIILDTAYICFHVNVKNTSFLLCAPNFDLLVVNRKYAI